MQLEEAHLSKMKSFVILAAVLCAVSAKSLVEYQKLLPIAQQSEDFLAKLRESLEKEGSVATPKIKIAVNDYVDKLLENLGPIMITNGWDPMQMPDVENSFKFLFVTGKLNFERGWLSDMYKLHRIGDATVNYEKKILNFKVVIEFTKLQFSYDYIAKLMNMGPSGGLEGSMGKCQAYIDVAVDIQDKEIYLQDLQLKNGKISLKWVGHPLVDWMTNLFTKVCITFFKSLILRTLSTHMTSIVEGLLIQINGHLKTKNF